VVALKNSLLESRDKREKIAHDSNERSRAVPSIKPVAEMRRKGISWQELKSNEYSCDVKNLEVKFSLQPNMAVNLENMSNFDSADVEIQSLRLKGVSGRVAYDGDQVFKGFRKIDETFHLIEYK
jgi:hypothetical protein